MRTMKKVLAAGLTAVMAMSLMVGCGTVWHGACKAENH